MTDVVGAVHEFHDADYVRDWAARFALFDFVLEQKAKAGQNYACLVARR